MKCCNGSLRKIDFILLKVFLFLIPFAFGLFYEFISYFAQIFLLLILLVIFLKRKKLRFYINYSTITLSVISLGYFLTCFYGIDKGMAFLGFLKFTIPLTFAIILMQYRQKQVNELISVVPFTGILMIILSVLFKYIPFLPDAFYLPNGRMAGFFQYSNTFALFLLIGIIILLNKKISKRTFLYVAILLIGILATGSRLVFLLTVLNFIIFIVKFKSIRKYLILMFGITILITLGYVLITKNFNTIGRYFTTSINSSTLLGRLLYYKDAIPELFKNPFGLGYMGYSYIQGAIQTGIYSTVFVHNDFLQLALDIGIIPLLMFIVCMIINLFSKTKFDVKKQILITLIIHTLFDFNLQFLSIFLILVTILKLNNGKRYIFDVSKLVVIPVVSIIIVVYLYFAVCCLLQYLNKSDVAIKMYPIYTNANESVIVKSAENNLDYANEIATKILETNSSNLTCYNTKALYYSQNQNWYLMAQNKKKSLAISKYDMSNYQEYILMLSNAIDYYVTIDDIDNAKKYINMVLEIPSILEKLKSSTSEIAYKINDVPSFELSEEFQEYIKKLQDV